MTTGGTELKLRPGTDSHADQRGARLYEILAGELVERVLSGDIAPGASLPNDHELTECFAVSRTVVREAIHALKLAGVFDVRHGAGTFVTPLRAWNVLDPLVLGVFERTGAIALIATDLLEVRRTIESEAASLAARRASDDDIAALQDLLEQMREPDITPERTLDLDVRFHRSLILASHNLILRRFAEQIAGALRAIMATMDLYAGDPTLARASLAGHELIFRALHAKDPERARVAILAHVQPLEDWAPKFFARHAMSVRLDAALPDSAGQRR